MKSTKYVDIFIHLCFQMSYIWVVNNINEFAGVVQSGHMSVVLSGYQRSA